MAEHVYLTVFLVFLAQHRLFSLWNTAVLHPPPIFWNGEASEEHPQEEETVEDRESSIGKFSQEESQGSGALTEDHIGLPGRHGAH